MPYFSFPWMAGWRLPPRPGSRHDGTLWVRIAAVFRWCGWCSLRRGAGMGSGLPPREALWCEDHPLRIAADRRSVIVRAGAKRPEVVGLVRNRNHSHGSGIVFAIERSWLGDIERAAVYVGVVR